MRSRNHVYAKTSKMDSKEQRSTLRAAVYRGDGPAVVHLLQNAGNYDDALQLAGDGLIAAVIQRAQGAPELARHLVLALRQRGWNGDDDLADQLDALLGSGPPPMLRPLPVELDELAGILEGDPLNGGGASTSRRVKSGPRQRSNTPGKPERKTRTPPMTPSGGCGCTARGRGQ